MDQFRELALTHFACTVAKDEEECINHVTFAASVGTYDGGEGFVEGSDLLTASV